MQILIDGDGVLFDLLGAIHNLNPKFNPKGVVDYNFKTETYGIPRSELLPYLLDENTFRHQPIIKGAKEAVAQMSGYANIIGWSDVQPNIRSIRQWQFKKVGIRSTILDKSMTKADVVIDDNPDQLARFDDNIQKFLINHTYNRNIQLPSNTIRVKNLMDVHKILVKQSKS